MTEETRANIKHLTNELSREDRKLEVPLLDLAVAGLVLGFRPSDQEMRQQAKHCWETLKPQITQHLLSEDGTLLPWASRTSELPPEMMDRIKETHLEIHALASKLAGVSFEDDPDEIGAAAGRSLCMLAVKLGDLIDSEESRLLPALRRILFTQP